jgi:hypothetical protein
MLGGHANPWAARRFVRRRSSGQAMVELMPAIMLFMLVVSAGLAYFRVMRAAARNEEASRNIAFAKINNAGTLTTVDIVPGSDKPTPLQLTIEGTPLSVATSKDDFIDRTAGCIVVTPEPGGAEHEVPVQISGLAQVSSTIKFYTESVICRQKP